MHQKIAEAHKLISAGHALLAEAHSVNEVSTTVTAPEPEKTKATRAKKTETAAATPPPLPVTPAAITMEFVKEKMLAYVSVSQDRVPKAKDLLAKFDAGRLPEVKPERYPEFLAELAKLSEPDPTAGLL